MARRNSCSGSLRIIGGQWRSRRIQFSSAGHLRPTVDSARETLFNWLQNHVTGATCLDLFAGSGALGFEALSRGAALAVLVDSDHRCIRALRRSAVVLDAENCSIVHSDALTFLRRDSAKYDLVFLDPPYRTQLAVGALRFLSRSGLHADARVYLEVEREFDEAELLIEWNILRDFKSGSRSHFLLARKSGGATN